jgi:hypothetical protein
MFCKIVTDLFIVIIIELLILVQTKATVLFSLLL